MSTLRRGMVCGFAISAVGWMVTECFPDTISALFTTDKTMIDIARSGFRTYFICYPVVGIQIVIQNYFQSIGKPKISIFLSLTRQLIYLLPLLYILSHLWGVTGVWASMAGSDVLAFLTAIITLWITNRRYNRLHAPQDTVSSHA
ncbi:MAG: MATE family efflux transporter, partial [Muribaculaceae bacterium]|nr:MATE family efflux transporter [Muribaculaceae bacterium]